MQLAFAQFGAEGPVRLRWRPWPHLHTAPTRRFQVGQFGRTGRMAGEFKSIHKLAIDGEGNLYTAEVGFGRRVQKFVSWGGF